MAEEALRQVEAEGLTLLKSEGSSTGYKGVYFDKNLAKPYRAQVWRGGKFVRLGCFATPEEGALCYARTPEARAAAAAPPVTPAPPPMTAEEAMWQAGAEGLTLLKSEGSSTGYKYVHLDSSKDLTTPYRAQVLRGGKLVKLGYFATAEEAALCYARTPEGRASAAAPPVPPAPPPMMADEAVQRAEAEGLTLLRSERNSTGYKGVSFIRSSDKSRPYKAQVQPRGGKTMHLGVFATAEEAALYYARTPEAQAAAAASLVPPPMTAMAEEALRQAEGLTLLRSESNSSGFKGVSFRSGWSGRSRPYEAQLRRDGTTVSIGSHATAEEAALHVARTAEGQAAVAAAAAAPPKPPPLTAEEAVQQAEAEGLTLLRSDRGSSSGYRGVSISSSSDKSRPYQAQVFRGGKTVHLGRFATAEEAALHVARHSAAQAAAAAPPEPPPLTAEEAVRQAEAEGLTLRRSESNNSGYKGVSFKGSRNRAKPYHAEVRRGGKNVHVGSFTTAEEAALCFARTLEAQAAAPQPPPASSRKRKVESEDQPPDEPADVVVILEGRFVESTPLE